MMKPQETISHVGSMEQVAYVRPLTIEQGRAGGLNAYQVKNGPLSFMVMADKCLDIGEMSYRGENFSFLSKPGLIGRSHFDTNGQEALRSIMGGLFFTCGLENICSPCRTGGKDYPMHGRMRTTPAQHLQSDAVWRDGEYVLSVAGEMREAELFGENMMLRRRIETVYGSRRITLRDEVVNQSFREEPMMLMYHFNIGYPLLSPEANLFIPSDRVTPRDEESEKGLTHWSRIELPVPGKPEQVYIHQLKTDEDGNTFVAVANREKGMGIKLSFNIKQFPYFMQWKSMAAGDYVMGLEPSNSLVYGRLYHEKEGTLPMLAPFGRAEFSLDIDILGSAQEIAQLEQKIEK